MSRLRLITGKGIARTNPCGIDMAEDYPMVGSSHCNRCCYNRGVVRILFWKFVKCNRV